MEKIQTKLKYLIMLRFIAEIAQPPSVGEVFASIMLDLPPTLVWSCRHQDCLQSLGV